ncbi:MAG TPA: phospholipase D-like domain-containing protein, partial [Herpetosiphonaceae bacterium]|nr:phospholipase D-like domain-containing protein [Herpetosiphonaceae bacterium]
MRDALAALPATVPPPTLCATLPVGLAPVTARALEQLTRDLRATLVDLVLSARDRIVLAAPFWDRVTVDELAELLDRRLAAGVRLDILTRSAPAIGDGDTALVERLGPHASLRLYRWYERNSADLFGTQTFHIKAAVIDDGERAYLGSANMTAGGLRSRMELGVELPAQRLLRDPQLIGELRDPLTGLCQKSDKGCSGGLHSGRVAALAATRRSRPCPAPTAPRPRPLNSHAAPRSATAPSAARPVAGRSTSAPA